MDWEGNLEETIISSSNEDNLKTCIDTLRDVLNEVCFTLDDHEMSIENLTVRSTIR